ncbi:hypothetical protein EI200_08365 [Peribacillus simplex]|nr:hypothetical protein EI200_08365 [Peribacillus simplex]
MIGAEGTDSCGKSASRGDPPQAQAEGGPPAESECLDWKSTFKLYKQKNCRQTRFPLNKRNSLKKYKKLLYTRGEKYLLKE